MALNFGFSNDSQGGEQFLPFVKYDARAGRIFRVDSLPDGSKNSTELTRSFKALFDLENVETGWIQFESGMAPIYALSRHDEPDPAKPNDRVKKGFRVLIQLSADCGGDVRELSSNARVLMQAMDKLHDDYLAGLAANPGKLPIVVMEDTKPIVVTSQKAGTTTNYEPIFRITGWATRPAKLVWSPKSRTPVGAAGSSAPAPSTAGASVPPYTGSTVAPPPPAFTPPPATQVAEDDFG